MAARHIRSARSSARTSSSRIRSTTRDRWRSLLTRRKKKGPLEQPGPGERSLITPGAELLGTPRSTCRRWREVAAVHDLRVSFVWYELDGRADDSGIEP